MVLGRPGAGTPSASGQRHGTATPEKTTTTPATHRAAVAKVSATSTTGTKTAAVAVHAKVTTPATAHKAAARHKTATKHRAVTHKTAKPKFRGNPVYADLPAPLQWQLAHNKVVVVSFYNPNADVDAISVAEAHAGAVEAGAGFLLVSVLDNKVAGILTALLPDGGLLPAAGRPDLPRAGHDRGADRRLRRPRLDRPGCDQRVDDATGGHEPSVRNAVSEVAAETTGTDLFTRHAKKDGRSVTILRAVDYGSSCIVEAEVFPAGSNETVRPGPYTFADAAQATAFVTEAVESLMYLGCDIYAD